VLRIPIASNGSVELLSGTGGTDSGLVTLGFGGPARPCASTNSLRASEQTNAFVVSRHGVVNSFSAYFWLIKALPAAAAHNIYASLHMAMPSDTAFKVIPGSEIVLGTIPADAAAGTMLIGTRADIGAKVPVGSRIIAIFSGVNREVSGVTIEASFGGVIEIADFK
jgi:hypothetical protein